MCLRTAMQIDKQFRKRVLRWCVVWLALLTALLGLRPAHAGLGASAWPMMGGDATHAGAIALPAPVGPAVGVLAPITPLRAAVQATPALNAGNTHAIIGTEDGRLVWVNLADGTITGSFSASNKTPFRGTPLVADNGWVYATNMDGRLYAFDEAKLATPNDPSRSWYAPINSSLGALAASPIFVIADGVEQIAVAGLDGRVHLINPATKVLTTYHIGTSTLTLGPIEATPVLGNAPPKTPDTTTTAPPVVGRATVRLNIVAPAGAIHVGDSVTVIEAATGTPRAAGFVKAVDAGNTWVDCTRAVLYTAGDTVTFTPYAPLIVAGTDGRVSAINADISDTYVRWTVHTGAIQATPVRVGDLLYVGDRSGALIIIDTITGKAVHTFRHAAISGPVTGLAAAGGQLLVSNANGVTALTMQAGPTLAFAWQALAGASVLAPPVTDADGTVLVATAAGNVAALQPLNGVAEWQWSAAAGPTRPLEIRASVLAVPTDVALAITADGQAIRLRAGEPDVRPSVPRTAAGSWPQFQRNETHTGNLAGTPDAFTAPISLDPPSNNSLDGTRLRWSMKTGGAVTSSTAVTRNTVTTPYQVPVISATEGSYTITLGGDSGLHVGDLLLIGNVNADPALLNQPPALSAMEYLGPITAIKVVGGNDVLTVTYPLEQDYGTPAWVQVSPYRRDTVKAGQQRDYTNVARAVPTGAEKEAPWYSKAVVFDARSETFSIQGRLFPKFTEDNGVTRTTFRIDGGGMQEIRFGFLEDDPAVFNPAPNEQDNPLYLYITLTDTGRMTLNRFYQGTAVPPALQINPAYDLTQGIDLLLAISKDGETGAVSATAYYRLYDAVGKTWGTFQPFAVMDLPTGTQYDTDLLTPPNPEAIDNLLPAQVYPFLRGYDLTPDPGPRPGFEYEAKEVIAYLGDDPADATSVIAPGTYTFEVDHPERFLDGDLVRITHPDKPERTESIRVRVSGRRLDILRTADHPRGTLRYSYPAGTQLWVGTPGQWTAYVGSDDGSLAAVDPEQGPASDLDGSSAYRNWPLWRNTVDGYLGAVRGTPAIDEARSRIYATSFTGRLFAFAQNGQFLWAYPRLNENPLEPISGSPALDANGNIYIGTAGGYIYKVTPDGELATDGRYPLAGNPGLTPIVGSLALHTNAANELRIAFGTQGNIVYQLSGDFTQVWSYPLDPTGGTPFSASPVYGPDGTLYIGDEGGKLYALTEVAGNQLGLRWVYTGAGAIHGAAAVAMHATVDNGTVYVGDAGGRLTALTGVDQATLQTISTVIGEPISGPLTLDTAGNVLAATAQGSVYCFQPPTADNGNTWKQLWRWNARTTAGMPAGLPIRTAPALWMGLVAIVGSDDGNVYAIGTKGTDWTPSVETSIDAPAGTWPMFHREPRRRGSLDQAGGSEPGPQSPTLRWFAELKKYLTSSPVVSTDAPDRVARVYQGTAAGLVTARNASTGTEIWQYALPGEGAVRATPAAHTDGMLAVAAMDGRVYTLRPDGTLLWHTLENNRAARLLGGFVASPVVVRDAAAFRIYAATADEYDAAGAFTDGTNKKTLADGNEATAVVINGLQDLSYEWPALGAGQTAFVTRVRIRTKDAGILQVRYKASGNYQSYISFPAAAQARYLSVDLYAEVTGIQWYNSLAAVTATITEFEVYTAGTVMSMPAVYTDKVGNLLVNAPSDANVAQLPQVSVAPNVVPSYVSRVDVKTANAYRLTIELADGTTFFKQVAAKPADDPATVQTDRFQVQALVNKVTWQSDDAAPALRLLGLIDERQTSGGGRVFALDANGDIDWQYPAATDPALAPIVASPAAVSGVTRDGDILYVATATGEVLALSKSVPGYLLWRKALNTRITGSPVLVERTTGVDVLVPDETGHVHLLNGTTGEYVNGNWPINLKTPLSNTPLVAVAKPTPVSVNFMTRASNAAGTITEPTGHSFGAAVSANGRFTAFASDANNLVNDDTNGTRDIFLYDQQSGTTTRISLSANGKQATQQCDHPSMSADGRYIAFQTDTNGMVGADYNNRPDIFVYDRVNGSLRLASVRPDGGAANGDSQRPMISSDGKWVAFISTATNLTSINDENGVADAFVFSMESGTVERVSVATQDVDGNSAEANGESSEVGISADGRFVAFITRAQNLDTLLPAARADGNNLPDIYVRDRNSKSTRLTSFVDGTGVPIGNNDFHFPVISADGRYVGFTLGDVFLKDRDTLNDGAVVFDDPVNVLTTQITTAGGMNPGRTLSDDGKFLAFATPQPLATETDTAWDVFVYNREANTFTRASVPTAGVDSTGDSGGPFAGADTPALALGADGRFVAFRSAADNLVATDLNAKTDIFLYDRQAMAPAPATARVSLATTLPQGALDHSEAPALSGDGRYLVFQSLAPNLLAVPDTNAAADIYTLDRWTGEMRRVSTSAAEQAGMHSVNPSISADGRFVAFASDLSNLLGNDTNTVRDIFIWDRTTGNSTRVNMVDAATEATGGASESPAISADGNYVAYYSAATNLPSANGQPQVYRSGRTPGAAVLVSTANAGGAGDGPSLDPSISGDGRYVAFVSEATNLTADADEAGADIFVRDVQAGTTLWVSRGSTTAMAFPAISADGRYVAFSEQNGGALYLYDRDADENGTFDDPGTAVLLTVAQAGSEFAQVACAGRHALTADGRMLLFYALQGGNWQVFVYDRTLQTYWRASENADGLAANFNCWDPASPYPSGISGDGRYAAFGSFATNLVGGEVLTPNVNDVFVRDLASYTSKAYLIANNGQTFTIDNFMRGHFRQILDLQVGISSSPAMDSAGRIYVGSDIGALLCIDPRAERLLWSYIPDRGETATSLYTEADEDSYWLKVVSVGGFKSGDRVQIIRPDGSQPQDLGIITDVVAPQAIEDTLRAEFEDLDLTDKRAVLTVNLIDEQFDRLSVGQDVYIRPGLYNQPAQQITQLPRFVGKLLSWDKAAKTITVNGDLPPLALDIDGIADDKYIGWPLDRDNTPYLDPDPLPFGNAAYSSIVSIGQPYGSIRVTQPLATLRLAGDTVRAILAKALPMRTSPAIGPGQIAYIGADDGILYAIGPLSPDGPAPELPPLPTYEKVAPWPTFHYDNQRAGMVERPGPLTNDFRWYADSGSTLESSPVIGYPDGDAPLGLLYVGTSNEYTSNLGYREQRGSMIAYDGSRGWLRWRFDDDLRMGKVVSQPALLHVQREDQFGVREIDEMVVFGTVDAPRAVNTPLRDARVIWDGTERWLNADFDEDTIPAGEKVVALQVQSAAGFSIGQELFLTDLGSGNGYELVGNIAWIDSGNNILHLRQTWTATRPHVLLNTAVRAQTSQQGHLYCVDRSGKLRWKFPADGTALSGQLSAVRSGVVVDNDVSNDPSKACLFFGTDEGIVYALNRDGQLIWSYQVTESVTNGGVATDERVAEISAPPTLDTAGARLFVSVNVPESNHGYVVCLNTQVEDDDKRLAWKTQLRVPIPGRAINDPIIANQQPAYDTLPADCPVTASPVLVTMNGEPRLYVATDNFNGGTGAILALDPATGKLLRRTIGGLDYYLTRSTWLNDLDDPAQGSFTLGAFSSTPAVVSEAQSTSYAIVRVNGAVVTLANAENTDAIPPKNNTAGLAVGMRVKVRHTNGTIDAVVMQVDTDRVTLNLDLPAGLTYISLRTNEQMLVVGSLDHNIYAMTEDLEPLWDFSTYGPINTSPAISVENDLDSDHVRKYTVYVGSNDHYIYAIGSKYDIDPDKRRWLRWDRELFGRLYGSPVIGMKTSREVEWSRAIVYQVSRDHYVYAFGDYFADDGPPPNPPPPPLPPTDDPIEASTVEVKKAVSYYGKDPGTGAADEKWWKFVVTVRNTGPGIVDKIKVYDTLPTTLADPDVKPVLESAGVVNGNALTSYIYPPVSIGNKQRNDLSTGGSFTANHSVAYKVWISQVGGQDSFSWSDTDGHGGNNIAIVAGAIPLDDGVTVSFTSDTGHDMGNAANNYWAFKAEVYAAEIKGGGTDIDGNEVPWEITWSNANPDGTLGNGFLLSPQDKDPSQPKDEYMRSFTFYAKVKEGRPDQNLKVATVLNGANGTTTITLDKADGGLGFIKRGQLLLIDNGTARDVEVQVLTVNTNADPPYFTVITPVDVQAGAAIRLATRIRVTRNNAVMNVGSVVSDRTAPSVAIGDTVFVQVVNHPAHDGVGAELGHNFVFVEGETYQDSYDNPIEVTANHKAPISNNWTDAFRIRLYYNGLRGNGGRLSENGDETRVFSAWNQFHPETGEPLFFKLMAELRASGRIEARGRRMVSFTNAATSTANSGAQFPLYPTATRYHLLPAPQAVVDTSVTPYAWRITVQQGRRQMNARVTEWGREIDFMDRIDWGTVQAGGGNIFTLYNDADMTRIKLNHELVFENPDGTSFERKVLNINGFQLTLDAAAAIDPNAEIRDEWAADFTITNPLDVRANGSKASAIDLGTLTAPGNTAASLKFEVRNSSAWGVPPSYPQYRFLMTPLDLRVADGQVFNLNQRLDDVAGYGYGNAPDAGAEWDGFRYDPYAEFHIALREPSLDLPQGSGLRGSQGYMLHITRRVPSHQLASDDTGYATRAESSYGLPFDDINKNGEWDLGERVFFDTGVIAGVYERNEPSIALSMMDTRIFMDMNGNGVWDGGEPFYAVPPAATPGTDPESLPLFALGTSLAVSPVTRVRVPTTVVDGGKLAMDTAYQLPAGLPLLRNEGNTDLASLSIRVRNTFATTYAPVDVDDPGYLFEDKLWLLRTGSPSVQLTGAGQIVWRDENAIQPLRYSHNMGINWRVLKSPAGAESHFGRPFELPIDGAGNPLGANPFDVLNRLPSGTYTGGVEVSATSGMVTGMDTSVLTLRINEARFSQVLPGYQTPPMFDASMAKTDPTKDWTNYLTGIESWPTAAVLPGLPAQPFDDLGVWVCSDTPMLDAAEVRPPASFSRLVPDQNIPTNLWFRRTKHLVTDLRQDIAGVTTFITIPVEAAAYIRIPGAGENSGDLLVLRRKHHAGSKPALPVWTGIVTTSLDNGDGTATLTVNPPVDPGVIPLLAGDTQVEILAHPWVPVLSATDLEGLRTELGLPKAEAFTDVNGNKRWDAGEPFVDDNANAKYDPATPLRCTMPSVVTTGGEVWLSWAVAGVRRVVRDGKENAEAVSALVYKRFNPNNPTDNTGAYAPFWVHAPNPRVRPNEVAPMSERERPQLLLNLTDAIGNPRVYDALMLYEAGTSAAHGLYQSRAMANPPSVLLTTVTAPAAAVNDVTVASTANLLAGMMVQIDNDPADPINPLLIARVQQVLSGSLVRFVDPLTLNAGAEIRSTSTLAKATAPSVGTVITVDSLAGLEVGMTVVIANELRRILSMDTALLQITVNQAVTVMADTAIARYWSDDVPLNAINWSFLSAARPQVWADSDPATGDAQAIISAVNLIFQGRTADGRTDLYYARARVNPATAVSPLTLQTLVLPGAANNGVVSETLAFDARRNLWYGNNYLAWLPRFNLADDTRLRLDITVDNAGVPASGEVNLDHWIGWGTYPGGKVVQDLPDPQREYALEFTLAGQTFRMGFNPYQGTLRPLEPLPLAITEVKVSGLPRLQRLTTHIAPDVMPMVSVERWRSINTAGNKDFGPNGELVARPRIWLYWLRQHEDGLGTRVYYRSLRPNAALPTRLLAEERNGETVDQANNVPMPERMLPAEVLSMDSGIFITRQSAGPGSREAGTWVLSTASRDLTPPYPFVLGDAAIPPQRTWHDLFLQVISTSVPDNPQPVP